MRIFVVEDTIMVRELLIRRINAQPAASVVGCSGAERDAVAQIFALRPDVVILDLFLSPGSGFEVLRMLRGGGYGGRILVYTSQMLEPYRRKCFDLGADGFYDKAEGLAAMMRAMTGGPAPRPPLMQ